MPQIGDKHENIINSEENFERSDNVCDVIKVEHAAVGLSTLNVKHMTKQKRM